MTKPSPSGTVEITAYDGMVVFTGFGAGPVILSADVAEQIGYQLSAAAFAAASGAVRTWIGPARRPPERPLPRPQPQPQPAAGPKTSEEPRNFLPPIHRVSGSA